jgi:3-phenylpropionate/trans-cinnamate dioxygenase ferredoxin subunit
MGIFVKTGSTGDFQNGTRKKVSLKGQDIMLARVGDKYYAIGNRCPHFRGDLSAGTLEGTIVTCPRHGSQFDLTDGHNVRWLRGGPAAGKAVPSFKVKVEGDAIMVEV